MLTLAMPPPEPELPPGVRPLEWGEDCRLTPQAKREVEAWWREAHAPTPREIAELSRLRAENAALAQRVADLERRLTRLNVTVNGGSIQELLNAGCTVRGAPPTGRIKPLAEFVMDAVAVGVAGQLKERDERLAELEQRPIYRFVGTFTEGSTYEPGNICVRRGGSWIATVTTKAEPGKSEDWAQLSRAGRDGRDAPQPKEPVVR
jgi:hypothetical protein